MTPDEAVVVRQLLGLVVERVHGPGVDDFVKRAETALSTRDSAREADATDPLAGTLRLIAAHGCSRTTGRARCPEHPGLSRVSFTGTADQWCDECRAYDALLRAGATLPCSEPMDLDEYGSPRQWCALPERHPEGHAVEPDRRALDTAASRLSEAYALLDGVNDDLSQALDDLAGFLRWAEPTSAMDQVAHALLGLNPYAIGKAAPAGESRG
ncbi:hypothetical protein ABT341_00460 [Pseudonocardia alni]|uniref:hypothetical protein n=1 Tax=Pseudonocardia alni TaxID=33907 RepID=UPI003323E61F